MLLSGMIKQPTFSIIIPVYKVEKYLDRFLDSVMGQTYKDYEVILVDDGSPDSSGAICDEYASRDSRLKVIHKPNGGVSSARNKGIDEARGEWLLFFDSDDVVRKDALELIHAATLGNPSPDTVIYAINEVMTDGTACDRLLPVATPAYYDMESLRTELLPYFCRSASFLNSPYSKAFKRSIIERYDIRFKKRVRGEDWLFVLEYFRHISSAVTIPDVLYYYMRNDDSAMSRYVPEQFQLWSENWESKLSLVRDFRLQVDRGRMNREMYEKIYYFLREIKEKEPAETRKAKIHDILHSTLLDSTLKTRPKTLRGWRAYIVIIIMRIKY